MGKMLRTGYTSLSY